MSGFLAQTKRHIVNSKRSLRSEVWKREEDGQRQAMWDLTHPAVNRIPESLPFAWDVCVRHKPSQRKLNKREHTASFHLTSTTDGCSYPGNRVPTGYTHYITWSGRSTRLEDDCVHWDKQVNVHVWPLVRDVNMAFPFLILNSLKLCITLLPTASS